jgi:hypothetical protein
MTIWYIWCWFGTFFRFWYHVPRKIWQPWAQRSTPSPRETRLQRSSTGRDGLLLTEWKETQPWSSLSGRGGGEGWRPCREGFRSREPLWTATPVGRKGQDPILRLLHIFSSMNFQLGVNFDHRGTPFHPLWRTLTRRGESWPDRPGARTSV